jgi:hypothetical protein
MNSRPPVAGRRGQGVEFRCSTPSSQETKALVIGFMEAAHAVHHLPPEGRENGAAKVHSSGRTDSLRMHSRQNPSSFPPQRSHTTPGLSVVPGDGFLSDATLVAWLRSGAAQRRGHILTLEGGTELVLTDGLRVLGRSDGDSDPYGFTGKVMSLRSVLDRGASVHSNGMRLGSATYDVELGVIAEPPAVRAA